MRYWLTVRDKPGLLVAMMRELAGNANISFEGDLSRCRLSIIAGVTQSESDVLTRNTIAPRQDFIMIPLEPHTIRPILNEILPEARVVHDIIHVQIEKNGEMAFAAYDCFHTDGCVVSWSAVPEALLDELQFKGVLKSFQPAPNDNSP